MGQGSVLSWTLFLFYVHAHANHVPFFHFKNDRTIKLQPVVGARREHVLRFFFGVFHGETNLPLTVTLRVPSGN